jgi:hypothetical protein
VLFVKIPALRLKQILWIIGGLSGCAVFGAQPDSLAWNEFRPRLTTDFGHVVRGEYGGAELEFQPLNRNTVVLEQSATYGESWVFDAGFKAIIWWPFQNVADNPYLRTIRVEPRLSQVKARRNFGEENSFLEFGFFPYKYNPDAQNLGEYLYRSGTYPGTVQSTDGFHLMDYAVYQAYGAHARWSHFSGRLSHDVNLFSEPASIPTGDLTPAYEFSAKLPLVQLGVGAAYNRFFSYNGDQTRPKVYQNGYFRVDSVGNPGAVEYEGPYGLLPNGSTVRTRIQTGDSTVHALHYYTQRGVKLMARAAVDLGFLVPEAARNPGDLRVFAEAAVLGWEDQPFFYEDRRERIPVMIGVNAPTFRLLDRLSVQAEYYRSRFASSTDYNYHSFPIWTVLPDYDPDDFKRDDWKWSIYGRKTLNRLLSVHVQVANDHLRLPEFNTNLNSTPLMQSQGDWYYLLRLESRL